MSELFRVLQVRVRVKAVNEDDAIKKAKEELESILDPEEFDVVHVDLL